MSLQTAGEEPLLGPAEERKTSRAAGLERRQPKEQIIDRSTIYRWVLIVLLQIFNSMGFIVPQPVIPFVQTQFFNGGQPCVTDAQSETAGCMNALAELATVSSVMYGCYGGMAFLMSPVVGRLSDAVGRRPLLILAESIIVLQNIALYFYVQSWSPSMHVSLWWYFVMNAIPDFVFAVAAAYVADLLPPRWRGFAFGLNAASGAVCNIVGPALTPIVDTETDFLIALIFRATALFIAVFVLPESLPKRDRQPFSWSIFNSARQLSILLRSKIFLRLALVIFISGVVGANPQTLFLRGELLFSEEQNAILQSINGLAGLLVQVALIKPLLDTIGERATVVLGLAFNFGWMAGYGFFITTPMEVYVFGAISAISQINYPAISAIKSMLCSAEEQGQILGALAGVQSIAFGVGPFIFNSLFSWLLRVQITRDGSMDGSEQAAEADHDLSPFVLGPRSCFVWACLPALVCVGLAASIPNPREALRKQQAAAGVLVGGDL